MSTIGAAGRALFFWREAVATRSGRHCIIGTKSIISSTSPVGTNFVTDIQGTAASMSIATAHKIEEGDTPRASRLQADLALRIVRMLKEQGAEVGRASCRERVCQYV